MEPVVRDRDGVDKMNKTMKVTAEQLQLAHQEKQALQARVEQLAGVVKEAFIDGYESGHNDTVESAYWDSTEKAEEWLNDNKRALSATNTQLYSARDAVIEAVRKWRRGNTPAWIMVEAVANLEKLETEDKRGGE